MKNHRIAESMLKKMPVMRLPYKVDIAMGIKNRMDMDISYPVSASTLAINAVSSRQMAMICTCERRPRMESILSKTKFTAALN